MAMKYPLARKIVLAILALAIIGVALLIFKKIGTKKAPPHIVEVKKKLGVFTEVVKNTAKPITISSNGALVAKNRFDLFSEVQGIFESSAHSFKPGVYYNQGDVLVSINSQEQMASLEVQKSNLYQKLVSVLPDLRLDYPNQFDKWKQYIDNFDLNQYTKALPTFDTNQEKLFISGKGIQSAYYSVKSIQERLSKYRLTAPYGGVLVEANVTKGTLIRPGQKLGTFINPNVYELEVPISNTYSNFLSTGKSVKLYSLDKKSTWNGKVVRINKLIDPMTQSNTVFVQVTGKGLKEGMYLNAEINGNDKISSFEIDRSLLQEGNTVFVVEKGKMVEKQVDPIYFGEKKVLVSGLEEGAIFINRQVPAGFDGKNVEILNK